MTEAHHSHTQARDESGAYYYQMDAPCECGHDLGSHDAERAEGPDGKVYQYCQADTCECECFKKVRGAKLKERGQ